MRRPRRRCRADGGVASEQQLDSPSSFAGLTDVGFRTFVTRRFLPVIHLVVIVAVLLGAIGVLASAVSVSLVSLVSGVFALLVVLLHLLLARVFLEMVALMFRIGENTERMANALELLSTAPPVEHEEVEHVDDPRVVDEDEDEYGDEVQYAPPPRRR